ncbi:hypothetical protein BC826DRAFT_141140 [Russula brevipes]|nr:hypothetical protein BC826DRAFT_141140 [Russula brevipes]
MRKKCGGHWLLRWELFGLAARGVQGATTPSPYAYLQLNKLACWARVKVKLERVGCLANHVVMIGRIYLAPIAELHYLV